jgi:phosphatidylethanolamine-binding protein (PEBP) family uncharacterized protein
MLTSNRNVGPRITGNWLPANVLQLSFFILSMVIASTVDTLYRNSKVGVSYSNFIFPVASAHKSSHNKHSKKSSSTFTIYSTAFDDGDYMSDEYICSYDGDTKVEGDSPPLAWKNPPDGTEQYLLMMWSDNERKGEMRYDWVVYDIDDKYTSIAVDGSEKIGKLGGTSPGKEYIYRSPCSTGTSPVYVCASTVYYTPVLHH